jgi:hypothetical protein
VGVVLGLRVGQNAARSVKSGRVPARATYAREPFQGGHLRRERRRSRGSGGEELLQVLAYGRERHLARPTRRVRVYGERGLRSQSAVAGGDRGQLPYE